ncbi:decapping and exoribonuclease protein-like isoform X1 [Dermacentor variabilis]|uniref:decapping and exoribonuclease protein-like isoform X1 n=1 Tax=Dermacentor variabilis TaxID=34621 RepID=UPI003F5C6A9F
MTVREALSWRHGDCPKYCAPCEIGHFTTQAEGEQYEYVDGAVAKRFLRARIPWRPMLNLNTGYEKAVRIKWESVARRETLLRWVILNKDKVGICSSDELAPPLETKSICTDFICRRSTLTIVMCTPYEENKGWRLVACRHKGIVYLHEHPTMEEVHRSLKERGDWKLDRMTYWGSRFHRSMTSTEPGVDPKEDELLREGDGYNTVLHCQLGSHSIVMGGEVKAVDPSVECKLGSTAGYVEFKTNRTLTTESQHRNFYECKLRRWWAQSRLGGVPKGLCGFRDDNGIVVRIQQFDVINMPDMAEGLWSEDVCMLFCNQLLSFIKEHVEGNDGRTVYHFEYVPSSREIICKHLTNPAKLYRLPDWFLEAFEDC